jgi:hypothetical protein
MHFSKREFVLNGRMLRMKREGNGVSNSRGMLGLMNCGFILYGSLKRRMLMVDARGNW